MNELILVEFLSDVDGGSILLEKVHALDKDEFEIAHLFTDVESGQATVWGKINSSYASVIKLRDSYFAEHMRISYISDDLKNKYRR
jgi:hypothetical protein